MNVAGEQHHDGEQMNWADYIDALRNSAWDKLYLQSKRRRAAAPPPATDEAHRDASADPSPPS